MATVCRPFSLIKPPAFDSQVNACCNANALTGRKTSIQTLGGPRQPLCMNECRPRYANKNIKSNKCNLSYDWRQLTPLLFLQLLSSLFTFPAQTSQASDTFLSPACLLRDHCTILRRCRRRHRTDRLGKNLCNATDLTARDVRPGGSWGDADRV